MADVNRQRMERYVREGKYDRISSSQGFTPCPKNSSPLPEIKEMRKRFTDRAIEQDLIDLGLERLLPFLD